MRLINLSGGSDQLHSRRALRLVRGRSLVVVMIVEIRGELRRRRNHPPNTVWRCVPGIGSDGGEVVVRPAEWRCAGALVTRAIGRLDSPRVVGGPGTTRRPVPLSFPP